MTNETGESLIYVDTLVDVWNATKETYSNIDITSTIFDIKSLLDELRQGHAYVIEYYLSLSRLCQQLDIYADMEWKCLEDRKHPS